ncbi:hypothetical protein D7Z26_00135 [Cohnella endophytica]|uniref:Uncharacterized protein n=1 Tax=Cohnella endophytica TaxID=2419778 RepID=A0A494Y5R4_9BACL|nr:hypothetical protein [Cohnella endophytica]RKP57962.1 hypothetical protein D7Z26_00135 [Cohnella endophytica]
MKIELLSNLPPIGESVAKLASKGGQLIVDIMSVYGFFALCLAFVGFFLMVPVRIYEKYYYVVDDETIVELNQDKQNSTNPAA